MSTAYISKVLRQRIIKEFRSRCAYCHVLIAITGARLVIDHIIPEAKGGQTIWGNLCTACHACNEFKGALLVALDPLTEDYVSLFHPFQQQWDTHFCWSKDGGTIIGLTPGLFSSHSNVC